MHQTSKKEMVLLYNIKGQPYTPQLKSILLRMGIRIKVVNEADYSKRIGELLGSSDSTATEAPAAAASKTIEDEMLVMHNFTEPRLNIFLGELRRNGIRIPLKAIITANNSGWTSYQLHGELSREHAAFKAKEQE